MGDVYQAADSKLGRNVALKILPETFARDADRLARFEREARMLAALNHPNIASIFGIERVGDHNFLVMELVDGETLAERIKRGPIPLADTLAYSRQILEALEGAHEKGVIHRDLKPANIKITSDGKIKVLDFGLAKSVETESASTVASNSPTLSIAATQAGMILGTASYMSPEQAKGKPVDRRTDIFAFGCILYEMVTGKRAFDGDDVSDILGAVLIREPDWTQLPPTFPPGLRRLLGLCLEKNFRNRRGSAADVRLDIELALKEPAAVAHTTAPPDKRPSMTNRVLPVAVAAVALALVAALVTWNLKPNAAAPPVVRFSFVLPDDQVFTNAGRPVVAWSPDGSRFVYVANRRLYLKTLGESDSRLIPGSEDNQGVLNPVFSSDGQSLAFFSLADGALKRIAVTGGVAVTIGAVDSPFGMSWGADDEILVGQGPKGIIRISAKGGQAQTVISLQPNEVAHVSEMLPGGDSVLFTVAKAVSAERWSKAQIVVQSLKSGDRKVLVEGGNAARYLPTGHLTYAVGKTLMAVPFDVKRLLTTGSAVALVDGVMSAGNSGASQFSISSNGALLYVPASDSKAENTLAIVDRDGRARPLPLPPADYGDPRVSPNGRQIAFHTNEEKTEQQNVWVYDLDGKTSARQLTFAGKNAYPIWSPDSQRILFQSDREGDLGLFVQRADGTGAAERVTKPDGDYYSHVPDSWNRDGDTFLFTKGKGSDSSVWTYSLRDKQATLFADAPLWQQSSGFSPDGHWAAYMSEEKGRNVFVEPFPRTGAKFQLKDSATHPVWSPDGKELFFMSNLSNGQLYAVSLRTQPSFAFGIPVALPIKGFIQTAGGGQNYDVTPDGKFLVVMPPVNTTEKGAGPQVQVVLNWFEELRQRVPVR